MEKPLGDFLKDCFNPNTLFAAVVKMEGRH